jgi:hypothetical protein
LPSYSAKKRSAPSGAMISSKLNGGLSMGRILPDGATVEPMASVG